MKANFKRRLGAYLLDMMLVGMVLMLLYTILPQRENIRVYNQEMNEIHELVLERKISFTQWFIRFSEVTQDVDRERVMYGVINAFLILGYFVILPYFNDGKTIGKKIVGIKVEREDKELLMLNDLLVRSFFVHGLMYMLVSLASVYILPSIGYFLVTSIFGFLQILLVISSVFMIIYRKDKRGLQDIFSKTRIVLTKN